MKRSMFVRKRLQFIEHDRHVARYADLVGLGLVGLGSRLIAVLAQGRAQAFKFRIDDQVYDALREMRSRQRTNDHHRSDYISFSEKEHREQSNSVDDRR